MLINCTWSHTTSPQAYKNNEQRIKKELLLKFTFWASDLKISTGLKGHSAGYIYLLKINRKEKIGLSTLQLEHKVRITSGAGGAGGSGCVCSFMELTQLPAKHRHWAWLQCTAWRGLENSIPPRAESSPSYRQNLDLDLEKKSCRNVLSLSCHFPACESQKQQEKKKLPICFQKPWASPSGIWNLGVTQRVSFKTALVALPDISVIWEAASRKWTNNHFKPCPYQGICPDLSLQV